jgi:hypothetical protein
MATVFWDRKRVLLLEFMQQGPTITSQVYCRTLKKLHRVIQNKRRRMPTSSVVLLHDKEHPHIAARTQALMAYKPHERSAVKPMQRICNDSWKQEKLFLEHGGPILNHINKYPYIKLQLCSILANMMLQYHVRVKHKE